MELELRNVGIIKSAHLEFIQGLNLIVGSSSSGKSTLLRAIRCMMDNSFSDSNISYGQKKLAIRMKYNDHSATYIRDLDNPARKSAYQVDGKVYTKVGRTSLEDLSNIFKLSPIEIDGEKINFNFSAQFSGPFLLLGSPSLLYSILTYRSTFDITKVNDLYFSDLKKVKQDINALIKTKETLDKEKEQKEKELQKLESFPTVFIRVQQLKQQYETLQKQKTIYNTYQNTLSQINVSKIRLSKINNVLSSYKGYSDTLSEYSSLLQYVSSKKQIMSIRKSLSDIGAINLRISDVLPEYEYTRLLRGYVTISNRVKHNRLLLDNMNIQDCSIVEILQKYIHTLNSVRDKKDAVQEIQQQLNSVSASIKEVGVCPLCNQPICNH